MLADLAGFVIVGSVLSLSGAFVEGLAVFAISRMSASNATVTTKNNVRVPHPKPELVSVCTPKVEGLGAFVPELRTRKESVFGNA